MFIKAKIEGEDEDVVILGFIPDADGFHQSKAICVNESNTLKEVRIGILEVDYKECLKKCKE